MIPKENVHVIMKCMACGKETVWPLNNRIPINGLCAKCHKMENYLKIVGVNITKGF